jgi:2-polyprenyl-3-methyl-5-hydroxy-6-metoxy-1,4-benzoquinol methylase
MEFGTSAVEDLGSSVRDGIVTPGGNCRHCGAALGRTFCNLGVSPLANSYLTRAQLEQGEMFFPLHAYVCESCFLVQLQQFETPANIFTEYAYFSSYSDSWLEHARAYTADMIGRYRLDASSSVIEIASNDGYLLQYFARSGIPVLGIEPARNVARVAEERGIPTLVRFFGTETAAALAGEGRRADLLLGNNVLAHVPDINDFVAGMTRVLSANGVITMEFPHLLRLMAENQFDTIYHEHFSYLSFLTVSRIFAAHGLRMFDVQQLPTHGGSLRVFATHAASTTQAQTRAVDALLAEERAAGLEDAATYEAFAEQVRRTKRRLLEFLVGAKDQGKRIAAYGAPAKGNTLLNFCGIGPDMIDFTVDRSPHKQDRFLPGSRLPIRHPDAIREARPDYLLILPWNLRDEVMQQMSYITTWGGQFVVPIPDVRVLRHPQERP